MEKPRTLRVGELDVAAQEEDVGVVAEDDTVEMGASDGVREAALGAHALAVEQAHVGDIVPVEAHIAADTAELRSTEGARERHAAQVEPRTLGDAFAQKVEGVGHELAAVHAIVFHKARSIEEIKFRLENRI